MAHEGRRNIVQNTFIPAAKWFSLKILKYSSREILLAFRKIERI
jgi:hypothetical protein